MQGNFTFFDKNDNSDKYLFSNSNYLDNNKLFVDNNKYLYNNKLFIYNKNTYNYFGNIKIGNDTKTSKFISNIKSTFPDFSTILFTNIFIAQIYNFLYLKTDKLYIIKLIII